MIALVFLSCMKIMCVCVRTGRVMSKAVEHAEEPGFATDTHDGRRR